MWTYSRHCYWDLFVFTGGGGGRFKLLCSKPILCSSKPILRSKHNYTLYQTSAAPTFRSASRVRVGHSVSRLPGLQWWSSGDTSCSCPTRLLVPWTTVVVIWRHIVFGSNPSLGPPLDYSGGHLATHRVRIQPVSRSSPGLQWWSSGNTSGPARHSVPWTAVPWWSPSGDTKPASHMLCTVWRFLKAEWRDIMYISLRSCVKVQVDVLGSRLNVPNSPYGLCGRKATLEHSVRTQKLCQSRGGRPGLPVPNSPYWLIDVRLYSAILRSLEQTHCARMWFYMSD